MTVEVKGTGGGDEVPLHKRLIHLFNAGGRPLSSDALNALLQYFESSEDVPKDRVQTILTELSVGENPTVTLDDIEPLLQRLQLQDSDDDNTIQVISCFEMPRHEWDQSHKRFVRCSKAASIHGEPLSKPQVVLGRLQMLDQCVQRVIRFSAGSSTGPDLQITPVKALVGTGASTKTVLGMVRRDISKGRVYVEDFSGVVQVANLQSADCSEVEGYISDGCCVLLQGSLLPNQAFGVKRIMEPHMESRLQAVASLRGRCLSGAQPLRPSVLKELHNRNFEDESQRLVFLNDCHLDDPIVLQSIAAVLHGYDGLPEGPPPVITLLGPFFKPRCGGSAAAAAPQPTMREMTAAFEALAAAINLFPAILAHSKIVLVPAPGDPGCFGVLPQRPLPDIVAQPVLNTAADVVLASNPCRLQFFRKEVVVFNSPCMDAFQSHSLVQSTGEETAAEDVFLAACTTMLSQRHVSPFPLTVQPVHWEFDSSLALFPQPDALVVPYEALLCNSDVHGVRHVPLTPQHLSAAAARSSPHPAVCICPGSVKLGTFAAYIPLAPKDEESEHSEAAEDNPDAPRSATATAAAAGNQTQAITQPSSQGSALAEDRLKELKGGAIGLTTGAGRRLGGASDDTSELPTLAAADDAMQGAAAAAQGASAGKQSGAAAGAADDAAADRGCVVEECEVPIEAVEDKGSDDDSDSDLDPDGFGGRSEDGDPIDREALDSEDDFDTGQNSDGGGVEDDMEASEGDEQEHDSDDDALFDAADEAVARKQNLWKNTSKSDDNSMEDDIDA